MTTAAPVVSEVIKQIDVKRRIVEVRVRCDATRKSIAEEGRDRSGCCWNKETSNQCSDWRETQSAILACAISSKLASSG